ncbi:MAG: GIY-YIG nuclease family protein [Candidatus Shapirobacteria bacterium]
MPQKVAPSKSHANVYFVYILITSGNTLYTGITTDLTRRVLEHNSHTSKSAKYTRSFDSCKLVYSEQFENRSLASKRESEIKKLSKANKLLLIQSNPSGRPLPTTSP